MYWLLFYVYMFCMHVFLCTMFMPDYGRGLKGCWPVSALEFFLNYIYCSGYPTFSSEKNVFQNHIAEPGLEFQPSPALLLRPRNQELWFCFRFLPTCFHRSVLVSSYASQHSSSFPFCLAIGVGECVSGRKAPGPEDAVHPSHRGNTY